MVLLAFMLATLAPVHASLPSAGNSWTPLAGAALDDASAVVASAAFPGDQTVWVGDRAGVRAFCTVSNTLGPVATLDGSGVEELTSVLDGGAYGLGCGSGRYLHGAAVLAVTRAGGLFLTTDGAVWARLGGGPAGIPAPVTTARLSPGFEGDHSVFAGTSELGVFESTDGGATFLPRDLGLLPDAAPLDVTALAVSPNFAGALTCNGQTANCTGDTTLFAGTAGRGIFRSINAGLSWSQVLLASSGSPVTAVPAVQSIALPDDWYVGGPRPEVLASLALTDGLGLPGGIYISNNYGAGFAPIATTVDQQRPATQLLFSPNYYGDRSVYSLQPGYNGFLPTVLRNEFFGTYQGDPARAWCALPYAPGQQCGGASSAYGDPQAISVVTVGDTSTLNPANGYVNTGYVNYVFMADANTGLSVFTDTSPVLTGFNPSVVAVGGTATVDLYGFDFQPGATATFQLAPVNLTCTQVLPPVTTTFVNPSHLQVVPPDSTGFGACGARIQVNNPDGTFALLGGFQFAEPQPRGFAVVLAGSWVGGGDTITLAGLDFSNAYEVKFTHAGDVPARTLPCDLVRVFCVEAAGLHARPGGQFDITSPAVSPAGLYDLTVEVRNSDGSLATLTVEKNFLFAQYRFQDQRLNQLGHPTALMFYNPEPGSPEGQGSPFFAHYVLELFPEWDPLNPSPYTHPDVYGSPTGSIGPDYTTSMVPVAGGFVVDNHTNPRDGVEYSGTFRTDGSGQFAIQVRVPGHYSQAPSAPTGRSGFFQSCGVPPNPLPTC
ncbi:MAG: WD40/YVTN/BNR-like repeat-containing protein [Candidatus Dormibacteria bacterium]